MLVILALPLAAKRTLALIKKVLKQHPHEQDPVQYAWSQPAFAVFVRAA
jgi:hypothetical protein